MNNRLALGIIILISIASGAIAIYSTANGPWGYSDPVEYISTAYSILHGHGVGYYEGDGHFAFTTIQPPFFSVVLSFIGLTGINLVDAARWLNIFSLVGSVFISGWIFLRFSRIPFLGIIASAIMCTFPNIMVMYSSSYSEPLFIFLFLVAGLGLLSYQQNERLVDLVIVAVIFGLIPLTRYSGMAILIAGMGCLFIMAPEKTRWRMGRIFIFTIISCLPTALWLIWVFWAGNHNVGGRNIGADWSLLGNQFQTFRGLFMDIVWKWIPFQNPVTKLSYSLRYSLFGLGTLLIMAISFLAERKIKKDSGTDGGKFDGMILFYFGISSLAFIVFLIATYLLTLPTIDIDNRMLLPFFVGVMMSLLAAFGLWQTAWFGKKCRFFQVLPWLVGFICLYWYIPQTREKIDLYHPGVGLTAYRWDTSGLIQEVRSLPLDTPVISNDWELLLLWTQRPIYGIWVTFPSNLPDQTGAYGTNRNDPTQSLFCDHGAMLVIFNDFATQVAENVGDTVQIKLADLFEGLSLRGTYPDGRIYFCNK